MDKTEFDQLEFEEKCDRIIDAEFRRLWNSAIDFCAENDLEPTPVMDILKGRFSETFDTLTHGCGEVSKL